MKPGIIAGTGPGLTPAVIDRINASPIEKYGCNRAYAEVDVDLLYANNADFWRHYWKDDRLSGGDFHKVTYHQDVAGDLGITCVSGSWGGGFDERPGHIHFGHGSGFEVLNVAYHYGVRIFILCGYDLRFPGGYNGRAKTSGSGRHYFGEYPPELQHWTVLNIGPAGELRGLLEDVYSRLDCDDHGIRIINTTPGSALNMFESADLNEALKVFEKFA